MKKKLIIINGTMGVGKTTISKELYKSLDGSFWLDGDNCWNMHPFVVNEENKKMVQDNISYMINSFLRNSSTKYVVFNWVIQNDDIMHDVLSKINTKDVDVYKITIMCSKEELTKRIKRDIKNGLRDEGNLKRSLERYDMYAAMDTIKVDTTNKKVRETVNKIIELIN